MLERALARSHTKYQMIGSLLFPLALRFDLFHYKVGHKQINSDLNFNNNSVELTPLDAREKRICRVERGALAHMHVVHTHTRANSTIHKFENYK